MLSASKWLVGFIFNVKGSQILTIGEQVLHYNPASYFVMSVDLPATGKVVAASPDKPYMAISLTISAAVVAEMMVNDPKLPIPASAVSDVW